MLDKLFINGEIFIIPGLEGGGLYKLRGLAG